jgi:signal transduction histidine kinase
MIWAASRTPSCSASALPSLAALLLLVTGLQPLLSVARDMEEQRYAPEAETAIYFCIREALQNAAKYAPAAPVCVTLARQHGSLLFEVRDQGPGFAPEAKTFE